VVGIDYDDVFVDEDTGETFPKYRVKCKVFYTPYETTEDYLELIKRAPKKVLKEGLKPLKNTNLKHFVPGLEEVIEYLIADDIKGADILLSAKLIDFYKIGSKYITYYLLFELTDGRIASYEYNVKAQSIFRDDVASNLQYFKSNYPSFKRILKLN
jgi:hypothetical protein